MIAGHQPESILIIRPSALGDVCRTVPVLVSLRRAMPAAQIDWIVRDVFAPAIAAHPDLTTALTFPRDRFAQSWRNPAAATELLMWLTRLRRKHYDIAIDCQGLLRSGMITRVTGAAQRVGDRAAREFAWLGYNIRHPRPRGDTLRTGARQPLHTVDAMLGLLSSLRIQAVPDMTLYVDPKDAAEWDGMRLDLGLGGARYAVLAPTNRWTSKRWPAERFAQLLGPLRARGFDAAIIIGTAREAEQVRAIVGVPAPPGMSVVNLVGKTTLGGTMAAIASAALVIANDSAPLHMAVGFNRACVALYGPTDPAVVGPYLRPETVVRKFTPRPGELVNFKSRSLGDSLMRLIEVDDVLERVDAVMHGSAAPAHWATFRERLVR